MIQSSIFYIEYTQFKKCPGSLEGVLKITFLPHPLECTENVMKQNMRHGEAKCWCCPVRNGSPQRAKGSMWLISALSSKQHEAVCTTIQELSSDWTTPGWMEDDPWEYIVSPVTESLRECSFRYPMQWDHTERWSPHTTCGNERPVPVSPGGCYIAAPANDSSTGVFTVSVCFLAVHRCSG